MKGVIAVILMLSAAMAAYAANPRYSAHGAPSDGMPMVWYDPAVTYWVDAGPLSSYVSHADAIALVSAAAAPWNQPASRATLTLGGTLTEDVNSTNVYVGSSGPIWPADVTSYVTNVSRIVVLLDADGSITDMLLGTDASAPANCRQNAVTESMDAYDPRGWFLHDMIVVNGRCTGPAPEQQKQLQYQLMRAFGRALGVGWSQTNDNVFTGSPLPTYTQQTHWPIMHPIDILCGGYSYQCLVDPFTLRDDDIAALALLYEVRYGANLLGKEPSTQHGFQAWGYVSFPDGTGMTGVNLTTHVQVPYLGSGDDWESLSYVTGAGMREMNGNPVTGPSAEVLGSTTRSMAGYYNFSRIPIADNVTWENVVVTSAAVNPMYVGQYAVGPYRTVAVSPSGTLQTGFYGGVAYLSLVRSDFVMTTTATDCSSGDTGSEAAPQPLPAEGGWTGRFCGFGHVAWMGMNVRAGRTMTVEATALDEDGNVSTTKALPMAGVWSASDATGTLPTIAASGSALNARVTGMTQLPVTLTTTQSLRLAIAEQRGDGRPDFGYRARVLYADTIAPAQIPAAGGTTVIRGMGFQTGNVVSVGGVMATVQSLTATQVIATVPAVSAGTKDVVVTDLRTGGTSKMAAALKAGGASTDTLSLVSAPSGTVDAGAVMAVPFAVRVMAVGGAPVVGVAVRFTGPPAITFGCGTNCYAVTDASGVAATTVFANAAGAMTISASNGMGASVSAGFTVANVRMVAPTRPVQYVAADADVDWQTSVTATENGSAVTGLATTWGVSSGVAVLTTTQVLTSSTGVASNTARINLGAGVEAKLSVCAWTTVCAGVVAHAVSSQEWFLQAVSGTTQSVASSTTLGPVQVRVTDSAGNSLQGAVVMVYQAVEGWQPTCGSGRCATPPVYGTSVTQATSDADGMITLAALEYANTASFTRIVVSAGSSGYLAMNLEKHP